MNFYGENQTVFVFAMNGATGEFHATADHKEYECRVLPDQPDKIFCYGQLQGSGREVLLELYATGVVTPVVSIAIVVPSRIPPTPFGMQCEIEPLWVGFGQPEGCHAVTCTINSVYNGGTANTCITPWLWPIP